MGTGSIADLPKLSSDLQFCEKWPSMTGIGSGEIARKALEIWSRWGFFERGTEFGSLMRSVKFAGIIWISNNYCQVEDFAAV